MTTDQPALCPICGQPLPDDLTPHEIRHRAAAVLVTGRPITEAMKQASRNNGKKGGRPRKRRTDVSAEAQYIPPEDVAESRPIRAMLFTERINAMKTDLTHEPANAQRLTVYTDTNAKGEWILVDNGGNILDYAAPFDSKEAAMSGARQIWPAGFPWFGKADGDGWSIVLDNQA